MDTFADRCRRRPRSRTGVVGLAETVATNVNGTVMTSSPRSDAGGEQCEVQRARAGIDGDAVTEPV